MKIDGIGVCSLVAEKKTIVVQKCLTFSIFDVVGIRNIAPHMLLSIREEKVDYYYSMLWGVYLL